MVALFEGVVVFWRLSVVHATAVAPLVTAVVPHPAIPPPVASLQTLSQSSNAGGVPTVLVDDAASPSNWNCPVSCTARTITTPAPMAMTRDNRSPKGLRHLPVAP